MNEAAVMHRSTVNMCFAPDNDTVVLRLQTGKDIQKAFVICEDPFQCELERREFRGKPYPMTLTHRTDRHYIWSFRIKPPFKRLQYYFEIVCDDEHYLVFDNRVCRKKDKKRCSPKYFKYAWINPSDVFSPPAWVKDTVWYQIMPDRFCRSSDSPENEKITPWGAEQKHFNTFYGGDLKGITQRLPYLKELGIGGIYLTPVFVSDSYHRYNTHNYTKIDPSLGTEKDMQELVRTAHSLGIRIMLDGVFNHCGLNFFAWKDVCKKKKDSPYYNWFFINDEDFLKDKFTTDDGRYYTFSFWGGMPKLNTNDPEVIKYFCDLCASWITRWNIDGIRFDVGDEISHTFMRALRSRLKPIKPDLYLLGEIWFDSITWLDGTQYDSVMNYPLSSCINDFADKPELSSRDFFEQLDFCLVTYPEQVTDVMFNFLDTHDTPRTIEHCDKNENRLLQRLAVLMSLPGTPCLYYGTEIALCGSHEYDNRSCMPWDKVEAGEYDSMLERVRRLIELRKTCPQLVSQQTEPVIDPGNPRLLHYLKSGGNSDKKIGVMINASKKDVPVSIDGEVLFSEGLAGDILKQNGTVIYETG